MSPNDENAEMTAPPEGPEDPVPLFGTWRRIYAAVVLSALLVMALVAVFSSWAW